MNKSYVVRACDASEEAALQMYEEVMRSYDRDSWFRSRGKEDFISKYYAKFFFKYMLR